MVGRCLIIWTILRLCVLLCIYKDEGWLIFEGDFTVILMSEYICQDTIN